MIISLAQGSEKAIKILTAVTGCEFSATGLTNASFRSPLVPCGENYVMVTYFPMSDIYSIACLTPTVDFFPYPDAEPPF